MRCGEWWGGLTVLRRVGGQLALELERTVWELVHGGDLLARGRVLSQRMTSPSLVVPREW